VMTPIVSLLTGRDRHQKIWNTMQPGEMEGAAEAFRVIPETFGGKLALGMVIAGFVVFGVGIISANWQLSVATPMAVGGMLAVFAGGVLRLASD
jgi:hypothetical protein